MNSSLHKKERVLIGLFLFIPLLLLITFGFLPLLEIISYSFTSWNGISTHKPWVGWDNYIKILTTPKYFQVFINNLYYFGSGLLQILIALYLAIILSFKVKFKSFFKASIVFPTKTYSEFMSTSGVTPPVNFFNFENYYIALTKGKMLTGFFNTFILILAGVSGSIFIGSMVAYVISRFNFTGKKLILFLYLFVSIIPMEVSQVSTFKIITALGLYNTRLAPILLYLGADVLMVYLYLQVLEKIPREIDKAAMLEGASYFQIYRKVIFPLLKPATASVIMLKVISIYNDFYIPHLYMPGENLNTISTALFNFMGPHRIEWNVINAAIILSLIPILIFFLILQKQIYTGLTAGSIK